MIVIVKKEICKSLKSFKMIQEFNHKGIKYYLFKFIWELKGYVVEEIE